MADDADDRDLLDEQALVERARSDVEAFAELYRRHVDAIHRFVLRRCGDRELAEDLTAATFERALAGLDRFRWHPSGVAPWLFRIASNQLADHYRRQGRRRGDRAQRGADRIHDRVALDDTDRIDDADRIDELRAALDQLNPRYQRALTLRHLSGLDHEQAARAMGVTPSLMAVLVHRATASLRRTLEKGMTS